jgi:spore germination protein YaaH
MRRFFFLALIGVTGVAITWWFFFRPQPTDTELLSPFSSASATSVVPKDSKTYQVYGFAPFWNLQRTTIHPELTHFAYFSLPITEDGKLDGINTTGSSVSRTRWESTRLKQTVSTLQPDQEFVIVFTQFNNESIRKILGSSTARATFLNSVTELLDTTPFPITSINLDIEYTGEASPELRQQFVEFAKETKELLQHRELQGKRAVTLSYCIYASAPNKQWLWDIAALDPYIDQVVVMAYDFHRSNSPVAGPVAPMFGGKEYWDSDIVMNLREFLKVLPSEKILLGVPFYGYEWETTSGNSRASVFPGTGSTASYYRVQELIDNPGQLDIQEHWDESALSPYLTFQQNNRSRVIYYENQRSLSYKLDLVKDLQLGGVAIWALGYESESREPWDVIKEKLQSEQ